MEIAVPPELQVICAQIVEEHRSEADWAAVESDDMFQRGQVTGGYEADERAFCFSYNDGSGNELWFQLTLSDVAAVARGETQRLPVRAAGLSVQLGRQQ